MWLDASAESFPGQPTDGRLMVPITLREEKLLMYFKALSPTLQDELISDLRQKAYAKSVTEKVKGSPIKDHVSNLKMEIAYGFPENANPHPE